MKKIYLSPSASIITLSDTDIMTLSPITLSTNANGDDDHGSFESVFGLGL